jgi:hypothetical protein
MKVRKKTIVMEIVNPDVAGIDIGSRSHWVSVGQSDAEIKEFGVYNENLREISAWLNENEIKTVAMESTGTPSRGRIGKLCMPTYKPMGLMLFFVYKKYQRS